MSKKLSEYTKKRINKIKMERGERIKEDPPEFMDWLRNFFVRTRSG